MDGKHPIDFGGLWKVATEWDLPSVDRCRGVGL